MLERLAFGIDMRECRMDKGNGGENCGREGVVCRFLSRGVEMKNGKVRVVIQCRKMR
jgi:hypothetical protein